MSQMYTDRLDGIISVEEFSLFRNRYTTESEEFEKNIELLKRQLSEYESGSIDVDAKSILEKYRKIDKLTFEIANEFISKVFIGNLENDGKREIRIEWKI